MNVSLRQLEHAVAVARYRSVHRAARQLCITQSGLSRSIRSLEDALGSKLFERGRSGTDPTPAGRIVLDRAGPILDGVAKLEREVELLQAADTGSLIVAIDPMAGECLVPPAVGQLLARHPGLRVQLRQMHWRAATDAVRSFDVDLAIADLSYAQKFDDLATHVIGDYRLHLFCRADHPLLEERALTLTKVADCPLIGSAACALTTAALGLSERPKVPTIEIDAISTAKALVLNSDTIMGATLPIMERELCRGEIRILPLPIPERRVRYGAIRSRERSPAPTVAELIAEIEWVEKEQSQREHKLHQLACSPERDAIELA